MLSALKPLIQEKAKDNYYKNRMLNTVECIMKGIVINYSHTFNEFCDIIDGTYKDDTRTGDEIAQSVINQFTRGGD